MADGWLVELAARLQRFNSARMYIVVGIGGFAGLCVSIVEQTVVLWLVTGVLVGVLGAALLTGQRSRPKWTPAQWVSVALAPFFNQFAITAPEAYLVAVGTLLLGLASPAILRWIAWLVRRFGTAEPEAW